MTSKAAASVAITSVFCAWLSACAPESRSQSIQEIMAGKVDPSADGLWDTVRTTVTAAGSVDRQPRSEAEWGLARDKALALIDGAHMLQSPRPVGSSAHSPLADASTPGTRTAEQISAEIAKDPARFYRAAAVLELYARKALAAVDAKDANALIDVGTDLDLACESCHAAYWYPPDQHLRFPDAEAFGKIAARP